MPKWHGRGASTAVGLTGEALGGILPQQPNIRMGSPKNTSLHWPLLCEGCGIDKHQALILRTCSSLGGEAAPSTAAMRRVREPLKASSATQGYPVARRLRHITARSAQKPQSPLRGSCRAACRDTTHKEVLPACSPAVACTCSPVDSDNARLPCHGAVGATLPTHGRTAASTWC